MAKQKRRKACELERIPTVGIVCPACGVFVKFHTKQTQKLECMMPGNYLPRKAIFGG